MDPTLQPTDQNGLEPQLANGLNVTPPRAEDVVVPPQIPGQARLDEAVGKAIGGTVIPTDIPPVNLPTTEKLDAGKVEHTNGGESASPKQEPTPSSASSNEKSAGVDAKTIIVEDSKNHTPGAYPTASRVGWLEAYKRKDDPNNEFRDKSIWMDEVAGSALFGAVWHNAAALVVIPIVCYVVFKLGGGVVSLILIMALGATYYKNSIRRFRRNARDDLTRELMKSALENDNETSEWINNFLAKFWLIYEPVLCSSVAQTVDSIVADQVPAFLDSVRLTTFTLGTKAPRVESIKAFPNTDPDVVMMDWRVSFTPTDLEDMTPRQLRTQINPKIVLTVRLGKSAGHAGIPILVEDMSFRGFMRFKLKLTSNFPHIKTVDFCFLEPPTIDYVLRPVGGETFGMDIAHIPGLQAFIREQTHNILGPMMYAPNVYTLDLEQIMTGGVSLTAAAGVVQFTIYNAKDLKNTELVGNSDPYVKIRLGNRPELASTAVKENTQNPVWDETNFILVNNLHEVVCMEVLDKDNVRKDRSLGQANFDLQSLEHEPVQDDIWCKVLRNGKERGAIRVRAAYFPVQPPQLAADGVTLVPVESNCGILAVNIPQAKDITRTSKTKSHCLVYLNGKLAHTTKDMVGASPAWGAETDLFITDLNNAQIKVDIMSEDGLIGTYGASAKKLIKDTTDKEDWVTLQGGEKTGKMKLTGIWKPILMGEDMSLHKPPFGVIRIQLFGARNLRNVELGGNSDPYVVITGDKNMSRGRTKVIDSDLNPVWNEIFYVPVNSLKQTFILECFDFQKISKDRPLGKTEFTVGEVVEELPDKAGYSARPKIDRWGALKLKDKEDKGELHYEISFYPSLKVAQEVTEADKTAAAVVPAVAVEDVDTTGPLPVDKEGPAEVAVEAAAATLPSGTIKANEVLDYDSGILVAHLIGADLKYSDTYCEFYVDSDNYQYKSQVIKSRNPQWNEFAEIFVKELEYAKLAVVVKEKTPMEDNIIGTFTSNIRTLLESATAEGGHYPILDKADKRGSLHLKFEYLPVKIQLLPRERLDNMGNLSVTLVRAKNLIAADRGGVSDPFVVFKLNGKEVFKSDVVKKSLNPEYNENFSVPITSRDEDEFTLEVFDWNQLSASKSLGVAKVDLRTIQLVLPNEFLFPLQNKQNQGEVQVRLMFMPEFLSSNKRSSFTSTFVHGIGGGVNMVGQAGLAGVGAVTGGVGLVADGVGAVGQGALDVTGAVGKTALKGVGTVGKGVGSVGKGVLGGISAGASALGLNHRKDRSNSRSSEATPAPELLANLTPDPPTASDTTTQANQANQANVNVSVMPSIPEAATQAAPTQPTQSSHRGSISFGSSRSRTSLPTDGDIVGEPGNLTIHIIEAKDLMGVDKSGTSDPYVKVSIGSKSIHKTKVKKENLAPNWNESATVPGIAGNAMTINFLVRDHNTIGSDKDLGEADVRLWDYIKPTTEAQAGVYKADFWVPLTGSGKLHIGLEFDPQEGSDSGKQKRGLFSRK